MSILSVKNVVIGTQNGMIDYFAATMCFIILNKLKQFGFYSTCYLIMIHNEGTLRKIFFTILKFKKNNIYHDLERSGCF